MCLQPREATKQSAEEAAIKDLNWALRELNCSSVHNVYISMAEGLIKRAIKKLEAA